MGIVIEMGGSLPQTPRRRTKNRMDAKILFFTGVRYERIEDDAPKPKPASRRRKAQKA